MSPASIAIANPRKFVASAYQDKFFRWIETGKGSAILKAVAGSGKSTSIVRALPFIPATATVLILAFNSPIAKEMKAKIVALEDELELPGRFRNVEAATFHSRGYRTLLKSFGKDVKVQIDDGKVRKILKDRLSDEEYEAYGDFVEKLVGFAKGVGIGIPKLGPEIDDVGAWAEIIRSQDMWLASEDANELRAVDLAQKALKVSNKKAKEERWIDFNDQLYLPLLWNLRLFQHDWVFVDEAQDTNPVRREFAARSVKPPHRGGRVVAVGDPCQSIYAFTGASTDALDQIAKEFNTVELPLTVSYRCPKSVGRIARALVPYFEVAPTAPEGEVLTLRPREALARLEQTDAVLCRKTAPLIELAFSLIAEGRGCRVLGKDIGAGLAAIIKKVKPKGVEDMLDKLARFVAKESAKLIKNGAEAKAEALADKAECIYVIAHAIPEGDRTVPAVLARITDLFADDGSKDVLTLCTGHKAKGREWKRVAIWMPELLPVKSAKTDEAYQQEQNLDYVMKTRPTLELIFVPGEVRR